MTYLEAKGLLLTHAYLQPDPQHPGMETGFVGMLRPYKGLIESNFHAVMQALQAVAPFLQEPRVERELVGALWGICHSSRAWGLEPEGMLRRNNLIKPKDIARLADWESIISYAAVSLLEGSDQGIAFEPYMLYQQDATSET